jgi:hypothetical protein
LRGAGGERGHKKIKKACSVDSMLGIDPKTMAFLTGRNNGLENRFPRGGHPVVAYDIAKHFDTARFFGERIGASLKIKIPFGYYRIIIGITHEFFIW